MLVAITVFALSLSAQSPVTIISQGSCGQALATGLSSSVAEICLGDEQVRQANAAKDARERSRFLDSAVQHYRNAVTAASDIEAKVRALNALAEMYDARHLKALDQMEAVLRELVAIQPDELAHVFRLARVQEDQDLILAAEDTLLAARREHSGVIEPYVMLAQFYSRRALAVRQANEPPKAQDTTTAPGGRDENGVYRVGGGLIKAPARVDIARYPPEALAAGIQGVVIAEIVVNEAGNVADAKILRSIPLLDEAALEAVRRWQYAPTLVDGQPVPVRLTVTVNFSTRSNTAPRSPAGPQ
jgi:TonB family protein